VGLPILNGFVGEFLVLSSTFATHTYWGAVATLGVIFSAAVLLLMIQRVFYGKQSALVQGRPVGDLNGREHIAMWPFILLMLIMGVASPFWLKAITPAVTPYATVKALPFPSIDGDKKIIVIQQTAAEAK
jgi:NADH-quinone oxidoreductase subunit M